MSAMTILAFLIMIVLAAIPGDHYGRLQKMGWAPDVVEYKQGRLLMDPTMSWQPGWAAPAAARTASASAAARGANCG